MRIERSGGRKERKCVQIALVFSQIRTKQLEPLRMNSRDSEKARTTASHTQGPNLPSFPLIPPNDSIPVPRSFNHRPVPLSPLELLPTEIHIEIVEQVAAVQNSLGNCIDYAQLCTLARVSPVFTKLAQAQLYHHLVLDDETMAREWLESATTIRGEFATRELVLSGTEKEEERVSATSCEEVLALQTSDLEKLSLVGMKDVRSSSLISSLVSPASPLIPR